MNYSYYMGMHLSQQEKEALGKLIKRRRNELGLTARQLAERVGVSDAHIIYIEKGQREATFGKLMAILKSLDMNVYELMGDIGRADISVEPAAPGACFRIPVVSWVTAGVWREVCDAFEPGDADQWIDSDVKGKNVFALKVTGDSMEPEFKEGEVVVVNPHLEATPNDYVVVKDKEGQATFKQLKKYGPRWVLHPLNPKYQDLEVRKGDFKIIGKVVKKEKRY